MLFIGRAALQKDVLSGFKEVGALQGAYDLALAFLDQTYFVDARVERKLAGILMKIYIKSNGQIDVSTLAKSGVERWSALCGPPTRAGVGQTSPAESSSVDNR